MPTAGSKLTRRSSGPKLWKSKEDPAARSAGSCDWNTREKSPKCVEVGEASEQVERTNEDCQLEGLKVLPSQDVEQFGADKLNNETAGKTGVKKRTGSPGTMREPRACLSRLGVACEEGSLPRGWRGWEQGKHAGVVVT